ncbi:hypothetical protein [Microlunatus sp. Gsoil 973]|uniref:hypothetical protein n=1 Tax=Microlunatus sp. Gsoil 973 TaxID=2672569 RepID=UPI0012B470DB|nr:hypothetical protein [Microlunatus sp. Gsoil 973]QGN33665.1 hypothetical protein GJV80_13555 [Microlunatus sp. Gsoil 973]
MKETVNPLLLQVLHRRRMLRAVRWSAAGWIFFGGLHIAVWWFAFENTPQGWPSGLLGAVVWPLLLLATASFVSLVIYTARWLLAPENPRAYDWLERDSVGGQASPSVVEPDEEDEPTIVRTRV